MPLITRFFWGDIDLKWFPEACWSHRRSKGGGFYDVKEFVEGSTMPGAAVLNIRDWRSRLAKGQPMTETTPLEIAAALDGAAATVFQALDGLRRGDRIDHADEVDAELQKNFHDCEALAWLGRYYAAKIRAACALALFDSTSDAHEQTTALRHLTDALAHWKNYAAIRDAHYLPALYNRLGFVDITALTSQAAADLEIARTWKPGTVKDDNKRGGTEKGFRQ